MGRGTGKLTRSVLKRTEELRGHPPVDMEGALSASAHSEVVAPRAGRGGTTSSNPLSSSSESCANLTSSRHRQQFGLTLGGTWGANHHRWKPGPGRTCCAIPAV